MTRWVPWLLTGVVWTAAFDLQVRRAADEATSDHLVQWALGGPPLRLSESLTPRVRAAAARASSIAGVVLVVGLTWRRLGRGATGRPSPPDGATGHQSSPDGATGHQSSPDGATGLQSRRDPS